MGLNPFCHIASVTKASFRSCSNMRNLNSIIMIIMIEATNQRGSMLVCYQFLSGMILFCFLLTKELLIFIETHFHRALARVQWVHKPLDLWYITSCTCIFLGFKYYQFEAQTFHLQNRLHPQIQIPNACLEQHNDS